VFLLLGQQTANQHLGFLPTRGSFMLDFVFIAMFAIIPVMFVSIYLVRYGRRYEVHKWLQIILAVTLLVAVVGFEIDMRFFTDWERLAADSPYFEADVWCPVWIALVVHLCFAVPTPLLWLFVIVQAVRRFPSPAVPSPYSRSHVFWARLGAIAMTLTAVTGWVFYWMAFVA